MAKARIKSTASVQSNNLEKFRRMATVIQDSNDAITFQDLDGNILAWTRGAELMYGYTEAEALNKNIVDTVPVEYQEEALEFIKALKRGELVPTLETKRKSKNGNIMDVWLTNTKLTDGKGKLTGIATTERDITGRKHSEASLREKFRELEYLREGQIALSERMRGEQQIALLGQNILSHLVPFTNSQIGAFYSVNDDKRLQCVSSYALENKNNPTESFAFGEGLVGQVALEKRALLIEDVPPGYFHKIQSSLGQMTPRPLLICPIIFENQVSGVIELGSRPLFTEHQRAFLTHVSENIGIAINTTNVRKKIQTLLDQSQTLNEKLEESQVQLKIQQAELQKASEHKSAFLANMSHEIRTPLGAILGYTELLRDPDLTESERNGFIDIIARNGASLSVIINEVLDLSKVEAGHLSLEYLEMRPAAIATDVVQLLNESAVKKGLRLELKSEGDSAGSSIISDPTRVRQVLLNLIGNAIKFTASGSVKVLSYSAGDSWYFEVTDTGIGIPEIQREKIFEMFVQADETVTRRFGGTGLGLALARKLSRSLGGDVTIKKSVPGEGSTFLFKIENHPERQNERSKTVSYPEPTPETLKGKRILVIDDTPDNQSLFSHYLTKCGALVEPALDGKTGSDKALAGQYDVVLMDIHMPGMDGYTATTRLREAGYTKPVIALTAHAMGAIAEKCIDSGCDAYLSKPVHAHALIAMVHQYCSIVP